jgi:hypothetical protein
MPEGVAERDLVDAWIRLHYARDDLAERKRLLWAHAVLDDICSREPLECLRIVQAILKRDRGDLIAASLAAGPVEDLLDRHGPEIIDAIEHAAKEDVEFRSILSGVWRSTIEESVWERVQRLIGSR